jgi:hypothetical protein
MSQAAFYIKSSFPRKWESRNWIPTSAGMAVLVFVTAVIGHSEEVRNDFIIVPGVRVGPITSESSEEQLKKVCGAANVQPADVPDETGKTSMGLVIFPDDPRKKIAVIWKDPQKRQGVDTIWLRSSCSPVCQSDWAVTNGISLGTSLQDMERLNGNPFTLSNFVTNGTGWVRSWNNGQLDLTLASSGTVAIRLTGPGQGQMSGTDQASLSGLDAVGSDNPVLQRLNPTVSEIRIDFKSGSPAPQ